MSCEQQTELIEQLHQRLAAAEKREADAKAAHARVMRANADLAARCTDLAERIQQLEAEQPRACPRVCGDMRGEYRRKLARAWKSAAKCERSWRQDAERQLELARDDLAVARVGCVPVAELRELADTWDERAEASVKRFGFETIPAQVLGDCVNALAALIAKHAPAEDEQREVG